MQHSLDFHDSQRRLQDETSSSTSAAPRGPKAAKGAESSRSSHLAGSLEPQDTGDDGKVVSGVESSLTSSEPQLPFHCRRLTAKFCRKSCLFFKLPHKAVIF